MFTAVMFAIVAVVVVVVDVDVDVFVLLGRRHTSRRWLGEIVGVISRQTAVDLRVAIIYAQTLLERLHSVVHLPLQVRVFTSAH